MATTVHIPDKLLKEVDRKAKATNLSRNRFIVEALKKALKDETSWTPEFLASLKQEVSAGDKKQLDQMISVIKRNRSSKKALKL